MKTEGAIVKKQMLQKSYWWQPIKEDASCSAPASKPGNPCPACGKGILAYDGLFLLTCAHCGETAENGAFT
jgi:hypothetical protein